MPAPRQVACACTLMVGTALLGCGVDKYRPPASEPAGGQRATYDELKQAGVELRLTPEGNVYFVDFQGSRGNDQQVAKLPQLGHVTELGLYGPEITDAGLAPLKDLTTLEELELGAENITDAGLQHVASLTHLKALFVSSPQVTETGMTMLKQALPNSRIDWQRPSPKPEIQRPKSETNPNLGNQN